MARSSLVLWGLFAAGCVAGLGYAYATRHPAGQAGAAAAGQDAQPLGTVPAAMQATAGRGPDIQEGVFSAPAAAAGASPAAPSMADPVLALSMDLSSGTPAVRAAAISALASAPPMQAISVLQQVLESAAPADRRLALAALHEMALNKGDADQRIRNAIRRAIDGSGGDSAFAHEAMAVLGELEARAARGELALRPH